MIDKYYQNISSEKCSMILIIPLTHLRTTPKKNLSAEKKSTKKPKNILADQSAEL